MKPTAEPPKAEPADAPAAPAAAETPVKTEVPAGEVPLAEPPKNIEFTEVSTDDNGPALATAPAEHLDSQATPKSAPKPHKPSTGSKPVLALSVAFVLFVALAAVAYYAYTKSQ